MRLAPGHLDERITIFAPSTTTNDLNEVVEGYTSIGKFWAGWRPGAGNERDQADKIEGSLDGVFTIRRNSSTKAITHRYKVTRSNGEEYMVVGTPTYMRDRDLYMRLPARMVTHG